MTAVEWRMQLNNYLQAKGTRDELIPDHKQTGPGNSCTWTTTLTYKGTVAGSGSGNTRQESIEKASKVAMKSISLAKYNELLAKEQGS